jgi:hypothetical protein
MINHDPSSFLQAVESRLDSIFGEDAKPPQPKDSGISPTAGEDTVSVTVDMREVHGEATSYTAEPEARETLSLAEDAVAGTKENILAGPVDEEADQASAHAAQVQDRSAYLSEIDKRFAAIFGDEDKKAGTAADTAKPDDLLGGMARADRVEDKDADQFLEGISLTSSSMLESPLKDLKNIMLSLESEVSDSMLAQLDDEVNHLEPLYAGDLIIQGFLRIIRFVERTIRVRGAAAGQNSMNLLRSVYDHLENVLAPERMTEAEKHHFLMESIEQYRSWVENVDLEAPVAAPSPVMSMDELKPLEMEVPEDKFFKDQKMEETIFASVPVVEETPPPARDADLEKAIAAMKDLPPEEAFAYALEEMKRTFQTEIDTLKEEIRLLKNAR